MTGKRKREISNAKFIICSNLEEALRKVCSDTCGENSEAALVYSLLKASKGSDQMIILKKIATRLKSLSPHDISESSSLSIEALCSCYIGCSDHPAHQRALASCLQASPHCVHEAVVDTLLQLLLERICRHVDSVDAEECSVTLITGLMENFRIGEMVLQQAGWDVFHYLTKQLQSCVGTGFAENPMSQNKMMLECLMTLQTSAKFMQKCMPQLQTNQGESWMMAKEMMQCLWEILADETYILDCRAVCGMCVPLVVKIFSNHLESDILAILGKLGNTAVTSRFIEYGNTCEDLPLSSLICFYSGVLGSLDSSELGFRLLVDILFEDWCCWLPRLTDVSLKLAGFRFLILWTNKACALIKEISSSDATLTHLSGGGDVNSKILDYIYSHWQDSVDAIRHQCREIFENVVHMHLLVTKEDPQTSCYLRSLARSMLESGWSTKGKYGPLCCLVGHLGVAWFLEVQPSLPRDILTYIGDQTSANHMSLFFNKLSSTDREHGIMSGQWESRQWLVTWVDPVVDVLCHGTREQKVYTVQHVLPVLMKTESASLQHIVSQLTCGSLSNSHLGALITCLKQARAGGMLKDGLHAGWKDLVRENVFQSALTHSDDRIRLDSLGLLCESHKTTQPVPKDDLALVIHFLKYNMNNQVPAFRQEMVALLKKLFTRLKDSKAILLRSTKQHHSSALVIGYKVFLHDLCDMCFKSLYIGACYPRRVTASSILFTVLTTFACQKPSNQELVSYDSLLDVEEVISTSRVQTLLECLTDSFELIKNEAFAVLNLLPVDRVYFSEGNRLQDLYAIAMELSESTKPQDSATAAYMLRLLLRQSSLYNVLIKHGDFTVNASHTHSVPNSFNNRCILQLDRLLTSLADQLAVAKTSLVHAAASRPMYPSMHCIRSVLADVCLASIDPVSYPRWRRFFDHLLQVCYELAEVVSPVISHSSPEGNVPEDQVQVMDDEVSSAIFRSEEEKQLFEAVNKSRGLVQLMPEYLLACCWRTVKEVSLILGQLMQTVPVEDTSAADSATGLLFCDQVLSVGQYFTIQLLESRHRGAFELAYAGFVKMCDMLWRSQHSRLRQLPRQWMREILADIQDTGPSSRLCATRRSAGVPFYIQAILATEPASDTNSCVKETLTLLLQLALPSEPGVIDENLPQVHSLNTLRALFKDSRLADSVMPFVADGVRAAILGFSSQVWAIRNSCTLLFSALMTRIFGVNRGKEGHSRKNCMTGREFFTRYPSLYPFLLDQLDSATQDVQSKNTLHLHPGLYPVLMILARLFPSIIEGTDSSLSLTTFIPLIHRCAASPVMKTRLMAARALRPLVCKDQLVPVMSELMKCLPQGEGSTYHHNSVHGILLQIYHLSADLLSYPTEIQNQVVTLLWPLCWRSRHLLLRHNKCLVTSQVFVDIVTTLLSLSSSCGELASSFMIKVLDMMDVCLHNDMKSLVSANIHPGLSEYLKSCVSYMLTPTRNRTIWSCDQLYSQMLGSPYYEVRLQILTHMNKIMEECSLEESSSTSDESILGRAVIDILKMKALGEENRMECLVQVLVILNQVPVDRLFPWQHSTKKLSLEDVLEQLLDQRRRHVRDDVMCALLKFSSGFVEAVLQHKSSVKKCDISTKADSLLEDWCVWLKESASYEQSSESRETAATVIHSLEPQSVLILSDLSDITNNSLWTLTMGSLQDEDLDVKEISAACQSQPTLALEKWVEYFVNTTISKRGVQGYGTLLDAVRGEMFRDLEDTEEQEVRLFDRGEINTYFDKIDFIRILCKQSQKYFDCLTWDLSSSQIDSLVSIVTPLRKSLKEQLDMKLESFRTYSLATAFTQTPMYEKDTKELAAVILALKCSSLAQKEWLAEWETDCEGIKSMLEKCGLCSELYEQLLTAS